MRFIVAGMGQNLAAFTQQIKHLQDQDQHQQHRDDPHGEHLAQISGERARGEKFER